MNKIAIIAGTMRTGTSAVAKLLYNNEFKIPNQLKYGREYIRIPLVGKIPWNGGTVGYRVYESKEFNELIRNKNWKELKTFRDKIKENGNVVLKFPAASKNIDIVQKTFPEAYYIYVLRNPWIHLKRCINKKLSLGILGWMFATKYIKRWLEGYSAMMTVKNLHVVSYERLLKFSKLEARKLFDFLKIEKDNIDISGIESN